MPKIITITLNTAIDNVVEIGDFNIGEVVKGTSYFVQTGKGINVSRAVESLKKPVTALGYVGSKDQAFFDELNSELLTVKLKSVNGKTRVNLSLLDKRHNLVTHVRTNGYELPLGEIEKFYEILENTVVKGDLVIISGSIPNNNLTDVYFKIITNCKRLSAKVILDASGKEMIEGIKALPDVIKPNLEELEFATSQNLNSEEAIVSASKNLNKLGIPLVFVSMGKDGVILTKKEVEGYWKASIGKTLSDFPGMEIGCGDSMVAGIATELIANSSTESLLRTAIGCSTANLFSKFPGKLDSNIVEEYSAQTIVKYFK